MSSQYIGKYVEFTINNSQAGYIEEENDKNIYLNTGGVLRKDDEFNNNSEITDYTWHIKCNKKIKSNKIGKEVKSVDGSVLGIIIKEYDNYFEIKTQNLNIMMISKTHHRVHMPKSLNKWWYLSD